MNDSKKRMLASRIWMTAESMNELYEILSEIKVDSANLEDMQEALQDLKNYTKRIIRYGDEISHSIASDKESPVL